MRSERMTDGGGGVGGGHLFPIPIARALDQTSSPPPLPQFTRRNIYSRCRSSGWPCVRGTGGGR